jgi:RNA polymerase-binding transcription factor DksA
MNRPPTPPLCYPIDYQLTIGRTIRLRLGKLHAAGSAAEARALEESLVRLGSPRFGACDRCGSLIPFLRVAVDPAARLCETCEASAHMMERADSCTSTF